MDYITLSNGVKIPQLGYGVYQVTKKECVLEQADMKVSSLYIAQVKQKYGSFAMIISYNIGCTEKSQRKISETFLLLHQHLNV